MYGRTNTENRKCADFQINCAWFLVDILLIPYLKLVIAGKHPRNRHNEPWRNSCDGWRWSSGLYHQWGETDWLRSTAIQCRCSVFLLQGRLCLLSHVFSVVCIEKQTQEPCRVSNELHHELYRSFWSTYSWFDTGHCRETSKKQSQQGIGK